MKIKTQIQIDSKRYPRALKTAKKLKEASVDLGIMNKEEIVFLGYISSCVALEAFINYMLYIFAQEDGGNQINKRFNRLKNYFSSLIYDAYYIKEEESLFLTDKQEIEDLLKNFLSIDLIIKNIATGLLWESLCTICLKFSGSVNSSSANSSSALYNSVLSLNLNWEYINDST